MSKSLEARIAKLEAATGIKNDSLTVIILALVDPDRSDEGELIGYESATYGLPPATILRNEGESEDALLQRAEASSKVAGRPLVFHEMRA